MIRVKEGASPYVIDRRLPRGIFHRAAGVFELVADDTKTEEEPLTFETIAGAEQFLRDSLPQQEIDAYEWTIMPLSEAT